MRMPFLIFACAIGAALVAATLRAPASIRQLANIRSPAHGRHLRTWLRIKYVPDPVGYTSPDRAYRAEVVVGDAEVPSLDVYVLRKRRGHPYERRIYRGLLVLNSFAWIPHRPHTLVASTGGTDEGVGVLALWDGRMHGKTMSAAHRNAGFDMRAWWDPRLERLRRARQEDGEGFQVVAVSAGGSAIQYKHGEMGDSGNGIDSDVIRAIKLPAS